jgi:hypothetical protein
VLVERGLVTADQATSALREWIQANIRAMLLLNEPRVLLAPARGGWHGPAFALGEVLPPETLRSMTAVRIPSPSERAAGHTAR